MKKLSFLFILFTCSFLSVSLLANELPNNRGNEGFVVVLDAGHGGHDPGNLGNGYMEKNIALNIVLKVGEILKRTPGVKVIYTRKDDTFVDLFVRGEIANKANADLFVSVHCDSHTSNAHGAGTFVLGLHANKQNFEIAKKENSVIYLEDNYETRYADYDINSPESVIGLTIMQEEFLDQSIMLAKLVQDNFTKKLKRNDRKVKQAGFIVLHQTFMPSVLIETGFLTNKAEGLFLNSRNGQASMGAAIAEAILNYKKSIPDNIAGTNIPNEATPDTGEKSVAEAEIKKPSAEIKNEPKILAEVVVEKEAPKKAPPKETIQENKEVVRDVILPKETSKKPTVKLAFKVQLMASSKVVPLNSPEFKGLNKISKESFKKMYRYMYGNTDSYMGAKLLKANADMKGFTTSFIVAYKDGKRIPLEEALKYVEE